MTEEQLVEQLQAAGARSYTYFVSMHLANIGRGPVMLPWYCCNSNVPMDNVLCLHLEYDTYKEALRGILTCTLYPENLRK